MRNHADEKAIVAAVRAAEARTSGQIVCVLARRSCNPAAYVTLYAAALALMAPWPLLEWTQLSAQTIFAAQIGVFAIAFAALGGTPLGVALTPRKVRRRQAYGAARDQFLARGLARTRGGAGVLIFVSIAEHYASIVADEALDGKISEREWRVVVDELTGHLREGRITEGFVAAVARCGDLLAGVAPPDGGGNDLPDELVRLS